MKNVTITEITGGDDVTFDQSIESDEVTALAGGVAVNGDLSDSAVNTGVNTGIMAGDDVNLDDSIVGNGNTQLNDSTVGAFSGRGPATNITGENVNTGSGDLLDVDAEGDAQVVTGNGNDVRGAVDVDMDNVDGPTNLAVGDGNRQQALEDNSTNVDGSFNTDNSIDDSFNSVIDDSFNTITEDNDTHSLKVDDSFNTHVEDNDHASLSLHESYEDNSHYSDDDSWSSRFEMSEHHADVWGDHNDIDMHA